MAYIVLNTTARMQARCNDFGTDILVSQDLLSQLEMDDTYELTAISECELKRIQLLSTCMMPSTFTRSALYHKLM
jgi:hypothetical protein